jgi:hypothetical protein
MSESQLRITTTAELLKAVELGIVDKTEARGLLGLGVKRGRLAKVQPRRGGKFTKGELVYPFNRFSEDAKAAMLGAQELAKSDDRTVDTGDLLLALVQEGALASAGVDEARVRSALEQRERNETPVEGIGPSGELKTTIETAFHAVAYPHDVGTDQLVLALASCDGIGRTVLAELGVTEAKLRNTTP